MLLSDVVCFIDFLWLPIQAHDFSAARDISKATAKVPFNGALVEFFLVFFDFGGGEGGDNDDMVPRVPI